MANDREFVDLIQKMMYAFGDCERPLLESAQLVEEILRQQMNVLYLQAVAVHRPGRKGCIGHEEFLFLMRKNKVKLHRLLKYLEVKDTKDEYTKTEDPELCVSDEPKSTKRTRVQRCMTFLEKIDQTGELSSILKKGIVDEVKQQRCLRLDVMTNNMNQVQYDEFCKARQIPFRRKQDFNRWLLKDEIITLQFTDLALEILRYLASETVAQIVDLSLLVKQDASSVHTQSDNSPVEAGLSRDCIRPDDIREAYRRYCQPTGPFISKTQAVGNMKLFCC